MLKKFFVMRENIKSLFNFFEGSCKILPILAVLEGVFTIASVVCSKMLLQSLLEDKAVMRLLGWVLAIIGLQLLNKIILHYRTIWVKSQISATKYKSMQNIAITYGAVDLALAESEDIIRGKENAINAVEFNDSIRNMIDSVCLFISSIVTFLGCVGVIIGLNAYLVIVVLVSFIPQFFINKKKKQFDFNNMKKWTDLNRKTNCYSSLFTKLETVKELLLYNAEDLVHDTIERVDNERTDEMIIQEKYHTVLDMGCHLVKGVNDAIIYGYLVVKLLNGIIQIPDFTLYIGGINNLSKSIDGITDSYISLKQYMNYLDLYNEFTNANSVCDLSIDPCNHLETIKSIEFSNVYFKYPGQNRYALENISLVLHENEHVSLVGRNGAGKTTFVKLLLGLYRPTEGDIKINGISIEKYSRVDLNKMYSVLFQDYHVFPISIYENVTLKEKKERDIKELYDKVGLTKRLSKLEQYDDTIISTSFEGGVNFSGGEKLKLALARVMHNDTSVIVLDEPSSALDPKAEYEFYQMINEMNDQKTVFFVSHRMSSSKFCSRILVFDSARLVGDGNHDLLYTSNEIYRSLYNAQAMK